MEKVLPTVPASSLRQDQAGIFARLDGSPVLLTHHGQVAGVLVHPDQWNELIDTLRDLEDTVVAQARLQEAQQHPEVIVDLQTARAELTAVGYLDEG